MRQFSLVRKAFLIAALIYVLNFVFGTGVALALNLSDPAIGSARDTWFTSGTALTAPGVFIILYGILLVLATRQRWVGTIGIVGVTLMTLISGMASIADMDMVQRVLEHHLTVLTAFTLVVLFVTIPTIIILGIVTLIQQGRTRTRQAIS